MAERSSLLQTTQLGLESVAGTAVAAGKRLLGSSIKLNVDATVKKYRPMGQKYNTLAVMGKESIKGTIEGQLCYGDMVYYLSSGVAYAAPAQQAATTAYKWTHTSAQAAEDTVKTYTVEEGGAVRAHKAAYVLVNNIGYTITRDDATIKGSVIGRLLSDGITMTATPTDIALVPVVPNTVDVTLDTAAAGLGTTKLTRVLSVDYETGDRYEPVWAVDSANTSWVAYVEKEPAPAFKLLVEADSSGMAQLTNMRNGTKGFIRVKGTGALIASTYYYTFQHDVCGLITDMSEFKDQDGVYAVEYTFTPSYDSTWGKAHEFQVTNTLTAL